MAKGGTTAFTQAKIHLLNEVLCHAPKCKRRKKKGLRVFFADALDIRAYSAELFDDALVASIDVVDAVDDGLAAGH